MEHECDEQRGVMALGGRWQEWRQVAAQRDVLQAVHSYINNIPEMWWLCSWEQLQRPPARELRLLSTIHSLLYSNSDLGPSLLQSSVLKDC